MNKTHQQLILQKIIVHLYLKKRKTREKYRKSQEIVSKEFIHRIFVAKNHVEYTEATKALKEIRQIINENKNP